MEWVLVALVVAVVLEVSGVQIGIANKRRRDGEARWRWVPILLKGWGRVLFGLGVILSLLITPVLLFVSFGLWVGLTYGSLFVERRMRPARAGPPFADDRGASTESAGNR